MTTFEDTFDALVALTNAVNAGDYRRTNDALSAAARVIAEFDRSPENEVTRFAMRDYRLAEDWIRPEDLDAVEAVHKEPGQMVVQKVGSGLMIDGYAPGLTDGAHGIGVEFDRGSLKINIYRAGVDDMQAVLHVDGRGVHVSDGLQYGTGMLFKGEDGVEKAEGAWIPEASETHPTPKV